LHQAEHRGMSRLIYFLASGQNMNELVPEIYYLNKKILKEATTLTERGQKLPR
jgi:hypothetical protein